MLDRALRLYCYLNVFSINFVRRVFFRCVVSNQNQYLNRADRLEILDSAAVKLKTGRIVVVIHQALKCVALAVGVSEDRVVQIVKSGLEELINKALIKIRHRNEHGHVRQNCDILRLADVGIRRDHSRAKVRIVGGDVIHVLL